jgi:hypothetical protein
MSYMDKFKSKGSANLSILDVKWEVANSKHNLLTNQYVDPNSHYENNKALFTFWSDRMFPHYIDLLKNIMNFKADTDRIKLEIIYADSNATEENMADVGFVNEGAILICNSLSKDLWDHKVTNNVRTNSLVKNVKDELLSDSINDRLKEYGCVSFSWFILLLVRVLLPETVCGLIAEHFTSPKIVDIFDCWRDVDEYLFEMIAAVNDGFDEFAKEFETRFILDYRFKIISGSIVTFKRELPELATLALCVFMEPYLSIDDVVVHHSWALIKDIIKDLGRFEYENIAAKIEDLLFSKAYSQLLFSEDDPDDAYITYFNYESDGSGGTFAETMTDAD